MEAGYVEDKNDQKRKARHLIMGQKSVFRRIQQTDLLLMDTQTASQAHAHHTLLVSELPKAPLTFRDAFDCFVYPNALVPVQGMYYLFLSFNLSDIRA